MDRALKNQASYIGKPASELPTPALLVNLPVLKRNIDRLYAHVDATGVDFRPHVKTLKTIEVTQMMLRDGKYRGVIASTICEIQGCIPLVKEGLLDSILYGLPIYPGALKELMNLRQEVTILLMIDNVQQIDLLEQQAGSQAWDVFIKLDVGSRRAGVAAGSVAMKQLINYAEASSAVNIHGFYCHAGHSYAGRSQQDAEEVLHRELTSVMDAAKLLPETREVVVSIGATPTAHVIQKLTKEAPPNVQVELHAGNFGCNDLQQVSTTLVTEADQAIRVATEVSGVYTDRNEALVNAGAIALSRETSGFPGYGHVVGNGDWNVLRLSQEHGILGTDTAMKVDEHFKVGQRVDLYVNHTCITAAAFYVYFVVDEEDVVRETWVPWKGW
ncbi:hypothetical protein CC79DRAFT_1271106 [Sarocladium strictum]